MPTIDDAGPVVQVRGLAKRYGEVEAVRGVDFEVRRGETYGFLGPNGAGKSTTIKMLCTLVMPSAGTATVAGHDIVADRLQVRRSIGLVFQDSTLDLYLTRGGEPALPRRALPRAARRGRRPRGRGARGHRPGRPPA